MGVGDDLALTVERVIAAGAVRVHLAAQHDQAVEGAFRRLVLLVRGPGHGAHAERGDRWLERGERRVGLVLDHEDGGIGAHGAFSPIGACGAPSRRRYVAMRASVLLAMGLLYIVWGSTYLAISLSVETIAPMVASGVRLILGGLLTLAVLAVLGRLGPRPSWIEIRGAALAGSWILIGGLGWSP